MFTHSRQISTARATASASAAISVDRTRAGCTTVSAPMPPVVSGTELIGVYR